MLYGHMPILKTTTLHTVNNTSFIMQHMMNDAESKDDSNGKTCTIIAVLFSPIIIMFSHALYNPDCNIYFYTMTVNVQLN